MNDAGPVVRALLLKADGSVLEIDYDSTPRNNLISKILGGAPTILGELSGKLDGVILTKKLSPDPLIDLPNRHTILLPYGEILGDVFVTRLDEHIQPRHFGLSEFESWKLSKDHCPCVTDCGKFDSFKEEEHVLDDEEEFDFEGENSNEDLFEKEEFDFGAEYSEEDEPDISIAKMYSAINENMAQHEGNFLSAEQITSVLDQLGFNVVGCLTAEEERELLVEAYLTGNGEKPTDEQLDKFMDILPRIKAAPFLYEHFSENDEDEDWVPADGAVELVKEEKCDLDEEEE